MEKQVIHVVKDLEPYTQLAEDFTILLNKIDPSADIVILDFENAKEAGIAFFDELYKYKDSYNIEITNLSSINTRLWLFCILKKPCEKNYSIYKILFIIFLCIITIIIYFL